VPRGRGARAARYNPAVTLRRKILLTVAGLIVLGIVTAATIAALVDPSTFKPQIAAEIRAATGRDVALDGDLSVEWFPWFAVTLGAGRLANPPGFASDTPFARWQSIRVGARLLPLLANRLEMDRIRIDGLQVLLQTLGDGRSNASPFGPIDAAGTAGPPGAAADSRAGTADQDASRSTSIAGVDLRAGVVSQRDAAGTETLRLTLDSLTTGAWRPGQADAPWTDVTARGTFTRGGVALRAFRFGSELRWSDTAIDARATQLSGDFASAAEAPAQAVQVTAKTAQWQSAAQRGRLTDALLTLEPYSSLRLTDAQFDLSPGAQVPWRVQAAVQSRSLRHLLAAVGVQAPATQDPAALGSIALTATAAAAPDGAWRVDPLRVELDQTRLQGQSWRGAGPAAPIEFDLAGDRIALARYLEPDDAAGEPFVFPGAWLASLRARGALRLAQATLDDTQLEDVVIRLVLDENGVSTEPQGSTPAAASRTVADRRAAAP
jgi:uncharacterized protein involved in outer membrane biogenesis